MRLTINNDFSSSGLQILISFTQSVLYIVHFYYTFCNTIKHSLQYKSTNEDKVTHNSDVDKNSFCPINALLSFLSDFKIAILKLSLEVFNLLLSS